MLIKRSEIAMAGWFEGYIQANGIRIHYHRTGNGEKPALVLLHGFADNGRCWTRVARLLETNYDIVMPDARNHGLSEGSSTNDSRADAAADVAGIIQELGLQRPRVLGHSMGAGTAALVAADYPTLVHSVILEDPPIRVQLPESTATQNGASKERRPPLRQWVLDLKSQTRDDIIATGKRQQPDWAQEEFEPWADSKLQLNPAILEPRGSISDPIPFSYQIFQRISCPILLITGDPERGAIVTPEVAQKVAQLWHDGRVIHIAGVGHNIRREGYDQFMAAVSTFLKEK
jgi:pimeloyl-ACP methyl ester carboxylesterase